jgi:hypothetical protein
MSCRSLVASAALLFALAIHPAIAKENIAGNWPSQSCGCNGPGKCYIAHRNDGSSQCLPDSSGGAACTGGCMFSKHPGGGGSGSFWGSIFRSTRSGSTGGGGLLAK